MNTKICSKCKEEKPRVEFHRKRCSNDGLQSSCKSCEIQRKQDYRSKNKKLISESGRAYKKRNRERINAYNRAHYKLNKGSYFARIAKRRAKLLDNTPQDILRCSTENQRVIEVYKLREVISKATGVKHHVDHIWPLSKGGPHWSGNLQIITAEENFKKGDSFCKETARVIQESLDEYLSARQ